MLKTVSSTEIQNRFGAFVQWANENSEGVVIEIHGKPKVVLISYQEYAEYLRLRKQEQKRKALAALDALKNEVRRQNPMLTTLDAYHLAGFDEAVIQDLSKSEPQQTETQA